MNRRQRVAPGEYDGPHVPTVSSVGPMQNLSLSPTSEGSSSTAAVRVRKTWYSALRMSKTGLQSVRRERSKWSHGKISLRGISTTRRRTPVSELFRLDVADVWYRTLRPDHRKRAGIVFRKMLSEMTNSNVTTNQLNFSSSTSRRRRYVPSRRPTMVTTAITDPSHSR